MYKSDLQVKWGQYIDTDKLVDTMIALYKKYGVRCSEYGVCEQLDVFFTNKRNLIDLLKTSENYVGDLRIVFDIELERENSARDVRRFCEFFLRNVGAEKVIIKKVDDKGKKQSDYLKTGIERLKPADLFNKAIREKLTTSYSDTNQFNGLGEYKPSVELYDNLNRFMMYSMGYNYQTQLKQETINALSENKLDVKLAEGMKTSRAFNRICTTYGINKCAKYEKLFAEYADMVSGLKRKLKFFISVNPLDYITMSNGVNWTSCHSVRNMGGWCGGTLSYMLDSTSIITFVHSSIPTARRLSLRAPLS